LSEIFLNFFIKYFFNFFFYRIKSAYGTISTLRRQRRELWAYSRDPIKAPLLMQLQGDSERTSIAVQMFVLIMKYMGDLPQARNLLLNAEEIFQIAMTDDVLRDELYCQIMKQLTENYIVGSEERGWDLMWLITGLFVPSQILLKELQEFLKTRPHLLAKESLQRLQKTIKCGNRRNPPYIVEIESIRQRNLQIFHKMYYPDDTNEALQIESSTKAKDLIEEISKNFKLKSNEGFCLFVKIKKKVISIPENYFIFDFIYDLLQWAKSDMPTRTNDQPIQLHYQLFFMRKLWINYVPGRDAIADENFYFYQELQKYLFGYFNVSRVY
jgi:myosin VIIa